jgi:hypothetical protein
VIPFDIELKFGGFYYDDNFQQKIAQLWSLIQKNKTISKSKIESKFIFITCIDIINITNIVKTCIKIFEIIMHIGTIFDKEFHHMNIIGYFLVLGWAPTIWWTFY